MRLVLVIVALGAIAVSMVQIRRGEATARHQVQSLQRRQVSLRRRLWDQQIRLGELTGPQTLRRRADQMVLDLDRPVARRYRLAAVRSRDEAGRK